MKKIYLSLAGMLLCGSIISQSAFNMQDQNSVIAVLAPNTVLHTFNNSNTDRAAGPFRLWVEPVGDVMAKKGLVLSGTTPNQTLFLSPTFMDSTMRIGTGTSTSTFVSSVLQGSVLDPKSTNLQSSSDPIVSIADPYSVDSLVIYGSYVKKTSTTDTLYTWLVWGTPSNSNVFTKTASSDVWPAPINTWRDSLIGPKITGAVAGSGNKVKPAAPSGNYKLIKYVLKQADSTSSGHFKPIVIPLPSIASIPAGNIVSCLYTFVPGAVYSAGDCIYSYTGATLPQNKNGFGGIVWGQFTPTITQLSDYVNHQVDPTSWCMGTSYDKNQRHNAYPAPWPALMTGNLITAPVIAYSIYGTATGTVGSSELWKNDFTLSQNTPNPFTNETTVNFQIKYAVSSVSLEIYDIRGVKMFEKIQKEVREGKYSVEINNVDFADGIYFYSLTVDGKKITKKMIVSK